MTTEVPARIHRRLLRSRFTLFRWLTIRGEGEEEEGKKKTVQERAGRRCGNLMAPIQPTIRAAFQFRREEEKKGKRGKKESLRRRQGTARTSLPSNHSFRLVYNSVLYRRSYPN